LRPLQWLIIEGPQNQAEPCKYILSTLPADTPIVELISAISQCWRIERDYQELKQDFGLGHHEGRGWCGFHPENDLPRGSPTRAAPCDQLDHDAAPSPERRADGKPRAMSLLRQRRGKTTAMTQYGQW